CLRLIEQINSSDRRRVRHPMRGHTQRDGRVLVAELSTDIRVGGVLQQLANVCRSWRGPAMMETRYRTIAVKDAARVRLASRNQKELTRDYPTVVAARVGLATGHSCSTVSHFYGGARNACGLSSGPTDEAPITLANKERAMSVNTISEEAKAVVRRNTD